MAADDERLSTIDPHLSHDPHWQASWQIEEFTDERMMQS